MSNNWVELHFILPTVKINFSKYRDTELLIINPALTVLGYTLEKDWYTTDGDSFGPLTRGSVWKRDNELIYIMYG